MPELVVAAIAVGVLASLYRLSRQRARLRRSAATTVDLLIDGDGVERRLADGRVEGARWSSLDHVEVVCTPVPTADGADAFALLGEVDGEDASEEVRGCLVPLGIGHDDDLLRGLARLPKFDMAAWNAAVGHHPPRRTVVWRCDQPPGGADTGGAAGETAGGSSEGTGNAS